jgi:hypothetical protein
MFQSLVWAGFESATGVNSRGEWIDQIAATEHDRYVDEDYARVAALGIRTVRDAVRWPLVDRGGRLDFTTVEPMLAAAERHGVELVLDLFHFGYPADLDPFAPEFADRFEAYCHGVARFVAARFGGPVAYTPVNEPSFFAWAAGDAALFAPHATGRGFELKAALAAAAIRGIDAIWAVDPAARIVNADPICRVVAPAGRPDLEPEARHFNESVVFESYDMLAGRLLPELGGSRRHLGTVGVNYYWTNQWEVGRAGTPLRETDTRCATLGRLVATVWSRYGCDVAITETSHVGDRRPSWLRSVADETAALLAAGVPLRGVCLYPILGMPEWHDRETWTRMGLWDLELRDGALERVTHGPTAEALGELLAAVEPEGAFAAAGPSASHRR